MNKILQLKNKLTKLALLDATFQVFGSESHQYKLNPCLRDTNIQIFESQYNITLPSEYRNFVLEVGNGGAGPGYGLEKIVEITETSEQNSYDLLSQPFPLTKAWNDLNLIIRNKANYLINSDAYFDDKLIQGTIVIAHYGCGIYAMLVITGEQRGKIWIDDRTNDNGIYPACLNFCHYFHDADPDDFSTVNDEEQALSFEEWYEHWLDRSLEQVRQE